MQFRNPKRVKRNVSVETFTRSQRWVKSAGLVGSRLTKLGAIAFAE